MDNADLNPPTPKSMSDWELEQALATAKAQSDGMVAAMILLEQESQLRSEDDAAVQNWIAKLEGENSLAANNVLAEFLAANPRFAKPQPSNSQVIEPADIEESGVEPHGVQDHVEEQVSPTAPSEPAPQFFVEVEDAPIIPVPMPAPVSQEAAFDELLAVGATDATDAISLPIQEDFSVTGVLGQIVEQVNSEFSADEDATALEESEHSPVGAFAETGEQMASHQEAIEKVKREKSPFGWAKLWSQINVAAVAIPAFASLWAATHGISAITLVIALGLAFALNLGFQALVDNVIKKGAKDSLILSRASFGVFANMLPALLVLAFRIVGLAVFLTTSVALIAPLISGAPVGSTVTPVAISWSGVFCLIVLAIAVVLALIPSRARTWFTAIAGIAALATIVVTSASNFSLPAFGDLDVSSMVLIVVYTLVPLIAISGYDHVQPQISISKTKSFTVNLIGSFLVPLLNAIGFAVMFAGIKVTTFTFDAFAQYFLLLPTWVAQTVLLALGALIVVLTSLLLEFASKPLAAFFLASRGFQLAIVATLLGVVVALTSWQPTWVDAISKLLVVLLVPVFAWLGIFICEGLLRHLPFHDVSLQRGYAFYKRISVFALIGFLSSVAFGLCITKVDLIWGVGYFAKSLDSILFFDNLSGSVWAFLIAVAWTLLTSIPKIHKQELEIAAIDERRSEIAGVELPQ